MNVIPNDTNPPSPARAEGELSEPVICTLADHLFRHESGRIVSILTGLFGTRNLQLAEDVVQESMIRALRTWPLHGVPENPGAWLLRTAKNLALDHLRREKNFQSKQPEIVAEWERAADPDGPDMESALVDDQLRLMFICCHPVLPAEAQTALALKTLCGFSAAEIASAFLISEAAVLKRLTRARQRLRTANLPFEIPSLTELPGRINGVLAILYLLFNEGYKATCGEEVVRAELCDEAIRLGELLTTHLFGDLPRCHALLALMFLTAARFPTRTDHEGMMLRLEDQDRSMWDQTLMARGVFHLGKSSQGQELSEYHLQAAIAACHTLAASDAATDWRRIGDFYDQMMTLHPSPVVALNRAVAISKIQGPGAAMEVIESSGIREQLENYHLLHAVLGELELKQHHHESAAEHFRRALALVETKPERAFLAQRLEDCLSGPHLPEVTECTG